MPSLPILTCETTFCKMFITLLLCELAQNILQKLDPKYKTQSNDSKFNFFTKNGFREQGNFTFNSSIEILRNIIII